MTNTRTVRKNKRSLRPGRFLAFIFAAALVLALILILRSVLRDPGESVQAGDALWDGSWYNDGLGCIQSDRALVRGMKTFEKKTGVKPFLTLLDGVDPEELDDFAQEQHEALFSGGDHLLVVYDEWGKDAYYLSARAGAQSALSEADVAALLSCIEEAYEDPANSTYAEAFGKGFAQGAKQVSVRASSGSGAGLLLALGSVLIVLSAILLLLLRKRALDAKRSRKKAERQ